MSKLFKKSVEILPNEQKSERQWKEHWLNELFIVKQQRFCSSTILNRIHKAGSERKNCEIVTHRSFLDNIMLIPPDLGGGGCFKLCFFYKRLVLKRKKSQS